MRDIHFRAAALAAVIAPFVAAQTFTDCNPTEKSCPNVAGLAQSTYSVDLTNGVPKDWAMTSGALKTSSKGGLFQINSLSDGPTIASDFSIFFGSVEVTMQAAPGAGIVSTFVMESIDLDEIDLEIIGSQTGQVQSNYFGKGNTTTYDRGAYHPVSSPQTSFHTYKVDWKPDFTKWYIDGKLVRTLAFADAVGGKNYPQTPINIRVGNWVAGRPGNQQGTIDWAGGLADMSKAPFNMYVTNIVIQNDNPCGEYEYTDKSGDWQSIKCASGAPSSSSSSSTSSQSSTADKTPSDTPKPSSTPDTSSPATSTPSSSADDSPTASSQAAATTSKSPQSSGTTSYSSAASDMSTPCNESSTATPITKSATPPIGSGGVSTPVSPITASTIPESETTVIITKSLTTCPVGHKITSGSVTRTLSTPSVSTIYLTTTSTICSKCTETETMPSSTISTYPNGSMPSPSEPLASTPASSTPSESPSETPVSPITTATSISETLTFSTSSDSATTLSATSTVTLTSALTSTATLPAYGQGNMTTVAPTGTVAVTPTASAPTSLFTGAASRNTFKEVASIFAIFAFYMTL